MSKEIAPAFQFYAAEYLSDINVELMSIEEEGCYLRLMAFCWREQFIPSDPEALARLCKGVKPTLRVLSCFVADAQGNLRHSRLDKERKKQKDWITKSREAGYKSAAKRWGYKRKQQISNLTRVVTENCNQGGNQMVTLHSSSSSSSSSSKKREKRSRIAPEDFTITDQQKRWATETRPDLDIDLETEKFRNYEFKDPKSDWSKTWKNWILNSRGNGHKPDQPKLSTVDLPNGYKWQYDESGNKTGLVRLAVKP